MGSLLPKTVVILGVVFLLLVEPPTVSGLKCYKCKGRDLPSSADIANITGSNGAIGSLGSRAASARETVGDCEEEVSDCDWMKRDEVVCQRVVYIIKGETTVFKGCIGVRLPTECKKDVDTKGDSEEKCNCDTDLCNGGLGGSGAPPPKNGCGLMSFLTVGVISVYKLL